MTIVHLCSSSSFFILNPKSFSSPFFILNPKSFSNRHHSTTAFHYVSSPHQHQNRTSPASSSHKQNCSGGGDDEQPTTSSTTPFESFSVIGKEDIPEDNGNKLWSTMSLYLFSLHVPLSFGVPGLLYHYDIDLQTRGICMVFVIAVELLAAVYLLKLYGKPWFKLRNFFKENNSSNQRSSLIASIAGLSFLLSLILITSLAFDTLPQSKDLKLDSILKKVLSNDPLSQTSWVILYCFQAPFLEEIVYRGYLLTSLTATVNWPLAVAISSGIFSAAHFSAADALQIFVIGCVFGCSYCWTGKLISPIIIHSVVCVCLWLQLHDA